MAVGRVQCVGRDRELATLAERRARSAQDGAVLLRVTGDEGIGRTTLVRRLAADGTAPGTGTASVAGTVLWAGAVPWERDYAGGVVSQLLQAEPPADRETAVRALRAVVDDRPALVVVDDAAHCDDLSLHALVSLVRHHRDLPVLVVLVDDGTDARLDAVDAEQLVVGGLPPAAIGVLAAAHGRALHPSAAEVLCRHAGGSPRDVLALLDEVPRERWSQPDPDLPAPERVVARVRRALQTCAPEGRAVVEALAVLGASAPLAEVAALAGPLDPAAAVDAASATGLVAAGRTELRLRSTLIRPAVLGLMGARRSAEAHRRAAALLERDPVRRLDHLVAATIGTDPALADELDAVARRRGADGAWAEAARMWRHASRLAADPLRRDELLTRAVDALVAAGDVPAATALVPVVESLRETPLRDAVLAYLAIVRGRRDQAAARLQRADDIVNTERDPEVGAMIAQRHVLHALAACRGGELVDWADRAVALAGETSPAGIEAAAIRGLGLAATGEPEAARTAYLRLADLVPHGAQSQRVLMGRGWLELADDDLETARASLEGALYAEHLGGSVRIALWSHGWLARVQFLTGEWDVALRTVEQGLAVGEESGITLVAPLLQWTAAQVRALRGDWDRAAAAVRSAEALVHGYEIMRVPCLIARAQVSEARADYAGVLAALEPLTRTPPGTTLDQPGLWTWPDVYANALVVEGRLDDADAFLTDHEARARKQGHRSTLGRLGYARGRLQGSRGDLAAARASFEQSLELLAGLPLRYDAARATFAYGQTLRRAGKRREADAVMASARDLYLGLGASTYVERCDRELKAGGLGAGSRTGRDPAGLTPQEESVAGLVAQGLSNREVAAQLFLSPKTVQYHLTRVYAKLGIRTRAELAAARSSEARPG